MFRAVASEETVTFEYLAMRVAYLEAEIEAALNLTCDHVDKVIVARKELAQKGETANKAILSLLEDMKKMIASNLDLTRQVGKLQNELALANKEALIAKAREIPGPSDA